MTTATQTVPDEETPLLTGQQVPDTGNPAECEPEVATLAGPSSQSSRTPSIKGKKDANGVVKKTPLPWVQFSITLFLQLAEPLTSQVISPVSSSLGLSSYLLRWHRLSSMPSAEGIDRVLNNSLLS